MLQSIQFLYGGNQAIPASLGVGAIRNLDMTQIPYQDCGFLCFVLDCNQAIPASLGVSAIRDLDVNSLAVPRKAKEAIGGISRLTHENGMQHFITYI